MRFVSFELRTTRVDRARDFYARVLGENFFGEDILVSALSAPAIARGARPHWLGHLGVGDFEAMAARFIAMGAEQLGPTHRGATSHAIFRDPFGAIVALDSRTEAPAREAVLWHALHTRDYDKAFATYASLFGWTKTHVVDLGPEEGVHQCFAWDGSDRSVGSVSNAALSSRIHTQWLYFFCVDDLDRALANVRTHGGITLPPSTTSQGDRVAPCDDPDGRRSR
jgi:predicted enzyme related to lactoylglutathione lyase